MSHVVQVQTKLHDPAAILAACQRLNLPAPVQGTAQLFGGEATGLLVQLPGWEFPAVIDPLTGVVRYDNYEGLWGEQAKLEARRRGYQVSEQALQDGSITVQVVEGA
jgi:hypothetical protein